MKRGLKMAGLAGLLTGYVLSATTVRLVAPPRKRLRILSRLTTFFSRRVLRVLSIRVNYSGSIERAGFAVSNHESYIDVLIIASLSPTFFVTARDIARDPLLGLLFRLSGCILINRRSSKRLGTEIDVIARRLSKGHKVVLFPEGMTTNGASVGRFHSSLLQAAYEARVSVQPLGINYLEINRQPVSAKNRDAVFYYGGMFFLPHLLRLTRIQSCLVEITALPPLPANDSLHRKKLTRALEKEIRSAHRPITS